MKLKKLIVFLILTVVITGCGSANEKPAQPPASVEPIVSNSPSQSPSPESSPSPAASPSPVVEKKLTATEQMALDYVVIYLNGSDLDAKKQFVSDKTHPDTQAIFELGESNETAAEHKLLNPQVVQSVDFNSEGKDVTATLIKGEQNGAESEIIILSADGKVAIGYSRSGEEPEVQKAYDEMRARFK